MIVRKGVKMDYLVRATAADNQIRAMAITSRELVEEARQAHETSPIATAALGRSMSGALMMADSMLKNEDDVMTLQFACDGPIGGITVTADHHGTVKGYVNNPNVILPANAAGHLNVGGALGNGSLTVIRDLGLKEPYVGQVQLYTGEIAEDLTYYFAVSEQTPSSVGLGVLMSKENVVREAGGFLIQLMPFAEDEVISRLEKNLASIRSVTTMLSEGMTPEDMLQEVLREFDLSFNGKQEVRFYCDCDRDRVQRALSLIGQDDLREIVADGKDIELGCHFCGKKYVFTVEDVKKLLK